MGVQNIFEELLPWIAVIIYIGAMVYKFVKDNKKEQQTAKSTPTKVEPKAKLQAASAPIQVVKKPRFEEGVSEVVVPPVAESQSEKKVVASFSSRQRTLRRAVLWSEILKTKF